jgi:formylglycine-generating enzyme required for sulfatase activity
VWEWCEDVWHKDYEGAPNDGRPWLTEGDNTRRVMRGGSWLNHPWNCRCANRNRYNPDYDNFNIGFRVVSSAVRTL